MTSGEGARGATPSRVLPDRMPRRLVQLYVGLVLYGVSTAVLLRSRLGLDPWDVFHQGVAHRIGHSIGTVTIGVGALVLLLWLPLRQRPGVGTVSNAVGIGLVVDATLHVVGSPTGSSGGVLALRGAMVVVAVLLNGVATGAYIGAGLGPGPRDGLMTGLVQRTGGSVRLVRTGIEVTVLAVGWLLGGTVGIGTLAYALGIGPVVHVVLPRLTLGRAGEPGPDAATVLPEAQ